MEQSHSSEANSSSSTQETTRLSCNPCSQDPAIGTCPEPDEYSLHLPTLFP